MPYFHVVFTLPAPVADIAYQNKAVIYDLLVKAAADTTLTVAARANSCWRRRCYLQFEGAGPTGKGGRGGALLTWPTWRCGLTVVTWGLGEA